MKVDTTMQYLVTFDVAHKNNKIETTDLLFYFEHHDCWNGNGWELTVIFEEKEIDYINLNIDRTFNPVNPDEWIKTYLRSHWELQNEFSCISNIITCRLDNN